jgi:hypothetical protein
LKKDIDTYVIMFYYRLSSTMSVEGLGETGFCRKRGGSGCCYGGTFAGEIGPGRFLQY